MKRWTRMSLSLFVESCVIPKGRKRREVRTDPPSVFIEFSAQWKFDDNVPSPVFRGCTTPLQGQELGGAERRRGLARAAARRSPRYAAMDSELAMFNQLVTGGVDLVGEHDYNMGIFGRPQKRGGGALGD